MEIRTFRAATLQEALEQVRETLGPMQPFLHTRQIKRSRLGFFASSEVEVEASIEMPGAPQGTPNQRLAKLPRPQRVILNPLMRKRRKPIEIGVRITSLFPASCRRNKSKRRRR